MSIRLKIIFSCLLFTYGCQSFNTQNIAPGYYETFKAINNAIFGYEERISTKLIQEIPYASMLLKIGKGPEGLLILESSNNDIHTWVSADGVYFVTDYGRLIKTKGLNNNLSEVFKGFSSLKDVIALNAPVDVYYSFSEPELRNLKINLNFTSQGEESIEIMGKKKNYLLIYETGKSEVLGWEFINKYWVDENYNIWKSVQHISPKLPPIEITITKKPS